MVFHLEVCVFVLLRAISLKYFDLLCKNFIIIGTMTGHLILFFSAIDIIKPDNIIFA